MPFTPAHPAIITPLLKNRNVSALALVIGSMAPDFEYFFKLKVNSEYSHTIAGLFYFDLPVTFLLAWIFLKVVRHNLMANLPILIQSKLQELWHLDIRQVLWKRWLIFSCSALLGSLSHIFWDSFTHNNTVFTKNLAMYDGTYIPYEGVKYPLWYALQHISTAVGLVIVILFIFLQKPKPTVRLYLPKILYWIILIVVMVVVVCVRFKIRSTDMQEGNFVVSCITGLCIGMMTCGLINFNNSILQPEGKDG